MHTVLDYLILTLEHLAVPFGFGAASPVLSDVCKYVNSSSIPVIKMKINIQLEIQPGEVQLATELLAVLRLA